MTETVRVVIGETCLDATVQDGFACRVEPLVAEARSAVERKCGEDPFFRTTYAPYKASAGDCPVVRSMCEASEAAGVGPMAAVAGAIACSVVLGLMEKGCRHAVVDNGGDVAVFSDGPVVVRILPDPGEIPTGFLLTPGRMYGICSSSGRNGHAVSLGTSDVCTVVSQDPALSDACATALGNLVSGPDSLVSAVETVSSINGVEGCMAVCGGNVSVCGDLPDIIQL